MFRSFVCLFVVCFFVSLLICQKCYLPDYQPLFPRRSQTLSTTSCSSSGVAPSV